MALDQTRTPVFDALKQYVDQGTIPFHVPGHKQGEGLPEFTDFVGKRVMEMDLTCMPDLDNICNPRGPIKDAEALTAEAYGADQAFFLTNGTTSGIQAMIMAVCQPGDKIILPRNAHKSAISGLIISGVRPVYLEPEMQSDFGVSMGISPEQVERALKVHPDAKAVFVINPNYYGTASDLEGIVRAAHAVGVPVIADEAHGAHLYFSDELPLSAMKAGVDLAATSTHKLAGSLTQSSILLIREGLINPQHVKAVLNLGQTTSPSYILLASLDVARKQMALKGRQLVSDMLERTYWLRRELGKIAGIRLLEKQTGATGCHSFDSTKITINVQGLGMSGYEMEKILRSEYRIQVELSDLYNVIILMSIGDTWEAITNLLVVVREMAAKRPHKNVLKFLPPLPALPEVSVLPREAFYSQTKLIPLEEAEGEISAESIMAYPPGIPLVCPGEVISRDLIEYVVVLKQENADLQGPEDPSLEKIKVIKEVLHMSQAPDAEEVG
ncbi:aminotransferase class I/II-fold pyridoxal phosphate-dependent enzyme [Metallumcola ferriviriculae]|uniref:Aminotransferase class I/II-fold pyridoxal phosphate-dependent enzyme n=1 Tax=Metallumcola ferriviriculae TaxID=3039180 RepID=A0AAU0UGC9_9FIRM|nr:aminotransferase class I/II-fold pyridoxal phosphate-dependent enzyme [Desulfitibacteraceae bacterium MK1]